MSKIAIVGNETDLTAALSAWLEYDTQRPHIYATADGFKRVFLNGAIDLVAVDSELSAATCLEVLRFIREQANGSLPVILEVLASGTRQA